jgi:hypothetical protein
MIVVLAAGCARPGDVAVGGYRPGRPTGAITSPSPSAPVREATCSTEGALLSAGEVDGASGLRAMGVELRDCGTGTIVLHGYPAARLWDESHRPISVTVKDGVRAVTMLPSWEFPPGTVTLHPGEAATSLFVWRNITEGGPVGPSTGHYLDVATAAGKPFAPVAMDQTIDLGTTGLLAVSPWVVTPRDPL